MQAQLDVDNLYDNNLTCEYKIFNILSNINISVGDILICINFYIRYINVYKSHIKLLYDIIKYFDDIDYTILSLINIFNELVVH